jgi:hypothetical protein
LQIAEISAILQSAIAILKSTLSGSPRSIRHRFTTRSLKAGVDPVRPLCDRGWTITINLLSLPAAG